MLVPKTLFTYVNSLTPRMDYCFEWALFLGHFLLLLGLHLGFPEATHVGFESFLNLVPINNLISSKKNLN